MTLQVLKAKTVGLHRATLPRLLLDTDDQDKRVDETPSLYHVLRRRERQKSRNVSEICDTECNMQVSLPAIVRTIHDFMTTKCNTITVDTDSIRRLARDVGKKVHPEAKATFEMPITMEDLHAAGEARKKLKAPGYDGISHDSFQLAWEIIKDDLLATANQMYMNEAILDSQKHSIIVCTPKTHKHNSPEDYRPSP